jgi:copper chaperone NosL
MTTSSLVIEPSAPAAAAARRNPQPMRSSSRVALAIASLALGLLFVLPLWHIGLTAPQYPEGLGLYISIDRIAGEQPQDLNSINGLNHYIGMKRITPEDIPELRFMPYLVVGLIALGLLVALVGKRGLLYGYLTVFTLGAAAGLADFYRWGYDYGHNLDPDAILKIPGMSYQPPLIGSKQLLNFSATSWPASGGWIAIGALLLGIGLAVVEFRRARAEEVAPSRQP